MLKVQIQYFEACPHWLVAEDRLRAALELAGEPSTVERCPVETAEDAERLQFHGSPSILLNGRDPFPWEHGIHGLSCRMYLTPQGPAGSPAIGQLFIAINEAVGT